MAKATRMQALDVTPVGYVLGFADPQTAYISPDGTAAVQIVCKTDSTQYGGSYFLFDTGAAAATIRNAAKAHVAAYILNEEGTVVPISNIKISAMFE